MHVRAFVKIKSEGSNASQLSSRKQVEPPPPLTATDTETKARLHGLPSCCMVHYFKYLRMLVLLCLCKCMNVHALLGLRLICAPFTSTHPLNFNEPSFPYLHPSPVSRPLFILSKQSFSPFSSLFRCKCLCFG